MPNGTMESRALRQQLRQQLGQGIRDTEQVLAQYRQAYPSFDLVDWPAVQQHLAGQPVPGVNVHPEVEGPRSPAWIQEQTIEPVAMGSLADPVSQAVSLLSPRAAEARVAGSGPAMRVVQGMGESTEPTYMKGLYKHIARQVAGAPETVTFTPATQALKAQGFAAAYDPQTKQIFYNDEMPPEDLRGSLAHEMMHFLAQHRGTPLSTDEQHAVIKTMMGSEFFEPYADIRANTLPRTTPFPHLETFTSWGQTGGAGPTEYATGLEAPLVQPTQGQAWWQQGQRVQTPGGTP